VEVHSARSLRCGTKTVAFSVVSSAG